MLSGAAADATACAKAGVRFEIVPGVPAATAVPAYAGIPLASDRNGELRVIHAAEISQVAYSPATLVVLGADAAPAELAKMLIAAGWPEATKFAITWDGTTSAQQTVVSSLGRIGPDLKAAGVSLANTRGSAVAVVGDAVAAQDRLSWFETKPLFGWRVLVPRTKEQAAVVSQRLREYGAVPEEVPTIAVEPPRTPQQMERAVKGLVTGRYQWVAFTSTNAVRAVRETVRGVRPGRPGVRRREGRRRRRATAGRRCSTSASGPTWCRTASSPPRVCRRLGRPTTSILDPINRVLLPRADIATETLAERGCATVAGRPRMSPPTGPCAPRRRRRHPRNDQDAAASTRCASPPAPPCGTWSASPASRTRYHHRRDRPQDRQDRGRVRPAGGCPAPKPSVAPAGRRAGRVRRPACAPRRRSRRAKPVRRPERAAPRRPPPGCAREVVKNERWIPRRRVPGGCAARRPCARWWRETSLRPGELVLPDVHQGRHRRAAPGRLHARRRAAHQGQPAQGCRGRGRRGRGRADGVRHPGGQGRPGVGGRRPGGHLPARPG